MSENFETSKIVLNKTKNLTVIEVDKLLEVINENDFWNIPIIHHDETSNHDGTSLFIEGYKDNHRQFITMRMPEKKYRIYKIHKAFSDFADA